MVRKSCRCAPPWIALARLRLSRHLGFGAITGRSQGRNTKLTAEPKHLPYLDGWRGCAILGVLIGHFFFDFGIKTIAIFGVEFFFVLSGRLMADILFVRKMPLRTFFFRRFSRIYPALLVYVVIETITFRVLYNPSGLFAATLALTFLINYGIYFGHPVSWLNHIWSICVEEHGYFALGLLRAALKHSRLILSAILVIGIASLINKLTEPGFLGGGRQWYNFRTDASICLIFLSAAARMALRGLAAPSWVPVVALAVAVACRFLPIPVLSLGLSPLALMLAVNTIDSAPAPLLKVLASGPLRQMGFWSFSLYLWQQPGFTYRIEGVPLWIVLPPSIALGLLSYYLAERPARTWLNARDPFAAPSVAMANPAQPTQCAAE
jgi:peptidoglycan/LPS O-acetylase OafA/YrhL